MALETLKGLSHINGHEIKRVSWNQPPGNHIEVNETGNAITFNIQNGPIKEKGVNGCQIDDMVSTALLMIQGLNKNFPDQNNAKAIACLYEAYTWLQQRKIERTARGVEGYNKA